MASGKGRGGPGRGVGSGASRRAAATEERRRQQRQRALRRRLVIAGLAAAVVALVFVRAAGGRRAASELRTGLTAGSCQVDQRTDPGAEHVPNATYEVNPPAGGEHSAAVASLAVVEPDGEAAPDPQLVHALEHGYVIFWYRPDIADANYDRLVEVAERRAIDVFVIPRPALPVPVAATAWHQRLLCQELEAEPLARFVEAYRNKGPEKIPH